MSQRMATSAARAVSRRRALSTSSTSPPAAAVGASSHFPPSSPSSPLAASLPRAGDRRCFADCVTSHPSILSSATSSQVRSLSIRWRSPSLSIRRDTSHSHATSRVTVRDIGSTPPLRDAAKPESDSPLKFLDDDDDDDDVDDGPECPPWQNPLHHNNPDYQIPVFEEDYAPGEEMPTVPLPPFEPEEEGKSVIAPPHVHALAEEIVKLNMLEVKELVDRIGEHFGFDDEDSYPADGGEGGEEAKEEKVVEERTVFDLKLTGFEAKGKIKVIKEVRAMAGLGLKEAKEMVEGAPTVVMKDLKKKEAEELKAKLEAVGATIEIV